MHSEEHLRTVKQDKDTANAMAAVLLFWHFRNIRSACFVENNIMILLGILLNALVVCFGSV